MALSNDLLASSAVTSLEPRVDRPEEGLARGRWPAPRWAVATLGLVIVLGAFFYLGMKAYRARRARRGQP